MTNKYWAVFARSLLLCALAAGCAGQPSTSLQANHTSGQNAASSGAILSEPGSDWKTYRSRFPVRFAYPPGWQEQSPGQLAGADGFARLEVRVNDGAAPDAVCQLEANRDKPARYGAFPQIIDQQPAGVTAGCLVLPSSDQPAERQSSSVFLVWAPIPGKADALLALTADRAHIQAIVKSLQADSIAAPSAASCSYDVGALKPAAYQQDGLSIDEFPVAQAAGCDPLKDPAAFSQSAATGAPARLASEAAASAWSADRLAALNRALKPFGFVLTTTPDHRFIVNQGAKTIHNNIYWIGQLSINAGHSDFTLPLVDSYDGNAYLLRAGGLHALDTWDVLLYDRIFPAFAGDDLVSLAYDYQRYPRPPNDPALVNVLVDGRVVDTYSVSGSGPAGGAVRGLWSYQGHWVLELSGVVIEDGKLLNDAAGLAQGATEIYGWRLLGGAPFYFFRKDGKVYLSYQNKSLPVSYDQVIHQPLCCAQVLLSMKSYASGLVFYAQRGGVWYEVVVRSATP